MTIVEQLAHLRSERDDTIARVKKIDEAIKQAKRKQENAQNLTHQSRIDRLHRKAVFALYQEQDRLTDLNARIKLLNSRLRMEQAKSNRQEAA